MRIVLLKTPDEVERGLQYLDRVEPGTVWIFPGVKPGDVFHSRNVPEPFDLVFTDEDGEPLYGAIMVPPGAVARAPKGTTTAYEARAGTLLRT